MTCNLNDHGNISVQFKKFVIVTPHIKKDLIKITPVLQFNYTLKLNFKIADVFEDNYTNNIGTYIISLKVFDTS